MFGFMVDSFSERERGLLRHPRYIFMSCFQFGCVFFFPLLIFFSCSSSWIRCNLFRCLYMWRDECFVVVVAFILLLLCLAVSYFFTVETFRLPYHFNRFAVEYIFFIFFTHVDEEEIQNETKKKRTRNEKKRTQIANEIAAIFHLLKQNVIIFEERKKIHSVISSAFFLSFYCIFGTLEKNSSLFL